MRKIKEYFEDLDAEVVSSRRVMFLETLVAVLIGIIIGILIAPPRKMKVGCNNGNYKADDGCCCGGGCDCDKEGDTKKEEEE